MKVIDYGIQTVFSSHLIDFYFFTSAILKKSKSCNYFVDY